MDSIPQIPRLLEKRAREKARKFIREYGKPKPPLNNIDIFTLFILRLEEIDRCEMSGGTGKVVPDHCDPAEGNAYYNIGMIKSCLNSSKGARIAI